jgi:hypothetical protein
MGIVCEGMQKGVRQELFRDWLAFQEWEGKSLRWVPAYI